MPNGEGEEEMKSLTLELPETLAEKLTGIDREVVVKALEAGLELRDEQKTEHPYITRVPGILSGRPIVRGTRIPVWQVANAVLHLGDTVEGYLEGHPHLTTAKIYDALSYYFDHREEIEKEIEENKIENVLKATGATMDEKGVIHFAAGTAPDHA
jgi:uncharacterized protein (DUF433 family)